MKDDGSFEPSNEDVAAIRKLDADNRQELYPSCSNYSKLRFLVRLLHIKLLGGWTDRSFDLLVDLLVDALPKGSALPRNFHETKKLVKSVGVGYTNIHACENDCILFWKEHENSCVLKRDAVLPRLYADMETMADAKMMSIAWPYNKLRISSKKALTPTSGNSRR